MTGGDKFGTLLVMTNASDRVDVEERDSLIGVFRRFGAYGPVYEVIGRPETPDDTRLRIRVLPTGEEVDYRVSEILSDPGD